MKKTKSFKELDCKICGTTVPKVDHLADRVTCSDCVQKSLRGVICIDDRVTIEINPNKTEEE
jgi:protein-arginine kinase activator protein McsA